MRNMIWSALLEVSAMIDAPHASEDRKLKAAHALAQLSGCYLRTVEVHDLAAQITALQEAMKQHRRRA
jgi:hypothetical protein